MSESRPITAFDLVRQRSTDVEPSYSLSARCMRGMVGRATSKMEPGTIYTIGQVAQRMWAPTADALQAVRYGSEQGLIEVVTDQAFLGRHKTRYRLPIRRIKP